MGRISLTGPWGEALAAEYLRKKRYSIVACNYRSKFGEIDLIAANRRYLVFVEVKYRRSGAYGNPAEAVDGRKQRTICRVADYYRMRHGIPDGQACRFDVVAVQGEEICLLRNAFPYQ